MLESPRKSTQPTNPEYHKWIIPFKEYIQQDVDLAPANRYYPCGKSDAFDGQASSFMPSWETAKEVSPLKTIIRGNKRRVRRLKPVKDLIEKIYGDASMPIDLTNDDTEQAVLGLGQYVCKHISFFEHIRPPYTGTFVKNMSPRSYTKLARNPAYRGLPETNYDYDSEAEWEPPAAEDEDLDDEDEKSEDEGDEEEMDGFLDDEDDTARRRQVLGHMEPVSSGLVWQGEAVKTPGGFVMEDYRIDVLDDSTSFPIDPFSTTHWTNTSKAAPSKPRGEPSTNLLSVMQPPRLPLSTVNAPNVSPSRALVLGSGAIVTQKENPVPQAKQRGRAADPNRPMKSIPGDLLPAFRAAVQGSDLTKAGLIEILKKQFPKCSKDSIKDTLSSIAVRQGAKESEKKWVLIT